MNHNQQSTEISSIQSCCGSNSYQSIYSRPKVWTAPWCHCGSWGGRPCPIHPPHHPPYHPSPEPCYPVYPPPPQCPPSPKPPWPPHPPAPPSPCPWPPHPPAPPPKPKPPKPVVPDNCSQELLWLMVGYWMGSNNNCFIDT